MVVEIVERKGIGHPDTIADRLAEVLAARLEETYQDEFGVIQHYNVDKVLVAAGEVKGGKNTKPVAIIFAGQYTQVQGINGILRSCVEGVLEREIELGLEYKILNLLNKGSKELRDNYDANKANDTSFAVGSPFTKVERLTETLGTYLDTVHHKYPNVGRDNKVMVIQNGEKRDVYACLAFIGTKDYAKTHAAIVNELKEMANTRNVWLNAAGAFITLTGTSLECGDSGMTGRGNRYNGLITPMSPMTMEAYCGKNNQTHVGRIYQRKAFDIAQERGKNVLLLNYIGGNINKPKVFVWDNGRSND
jgi:S-adenosylmethionine synthetase